MPDIKGTTYDVGCYVDGHWGQYGASRVLRIADDILGTNYWDDTQTAMLAHITPDEDYTDEQCGIGGHTGELVGCEHTSWAADEAETALNDATPAGWMWHWHDGEFFLSPICDDENNCTDETCAHWC